jgi:hypothetical protein
MKKLVLPALALMMAAPVLAQCTFDSQYAGNGAGIYGTLAPVQACTGCGDATRSVSIVTVTDTLVAAGPITTTLYFNAMKVLSVEGNPAGTTYGTDLGAGPNGMGQWNNGGTAPNLTPANGCVYVSGTEATWISALGGGPNSDGIYPLTILVDAQISSSNPDISFIIANGSWLSAVPANLGGGPIVFDQYAVVVVDGTAVGIEDMSLVELNSHFPNPATTEVVFNLGKREKATLEVFDMLGARVMRTGLAGHYPKADVSSLVAGTYVYRLADENGQLLATRKLSVVR